MNRLPEWIQDDPNYLQLSPAQRHMLGVIAHRCDQPADDGSLLGCLGGADFRAEVGASQRTFWSHLAALEGFDFVVTVNRGGGRFSNAYSIPGSRGCLDHLRVQRRSSKHGRGGAPASKYDLTHHRPVQTAGAKTTRLACDSGTASVQTSHGTRANVAWQACEDRTLPSPLPTLSQRPDQSQYHSAASGDAARSKDASLARDDEKAQAVLEHFRTGWSQKYRQPFHNRRSDTTYALKVLKAADWDVDRATQMVERYLSIEEDYYFRNDHSIKLMGDQLLRVASSAPSASARPRCAAEQRPMPQPDNEPEEDLFAALTAEPELADEEDHNDDDDGDIDIPVELVVATLKVLGFSVTRATELVGNATRADDRHYIADLCRMAGEPEILGERTPIQFIEDALSDPFYTGKG